MDYVSFSLQPDITKVSFDVNLVQMLGLDYLVFTSQDGLIRANSVLNQMYIYSSIVDPIYVGNVRVPLLRSIWMNSAYKPGEVVHIKLDYPIYLPVASRSFNQIEINIRDDSGSPVGFSLGSKTSLTLHFRQEK